MQFSSSRLAFLPSTPLLTSPRPKRFPIHPPLISSLSPPSLPSLPSLPTLPSFSNLLAPVLISTLLFTSALPVEAARPARGGGDTFLSASGDVIKDPESLLRWSLPISNRPIRELQSELEAAVTDLRGLKWPKVENHIRSAIRVLNVSAAAILADVSPPVAENAASLLATVAERIPDIEKAVADKSPDKVTTIVRDVLRDVGKVEEMMVDKFPFQIPDEWQSLPRLKGRATVEILVKKADGDQFDIEGKLYDQGKMTIVADGYTAPISAGTFVDLVSKGFYNDNDIVRSDGFIVQAGKPKKGDGYVNDNGKLRTIPLEVFARGDKEPTYGVTLEDDGRGTVGTVLPFSANGTMAMARAEFEPNTASSQFFWFLFEPDLTPAGRNLMDGSWAVFGYTTSGDKFLKGLQKGDTIVSAKVVEGMENLIR